MNKQIISSWPSFSMEEAEAVKNVVLSNKVNYWTGVEGREFEKEFASWADSDYAIALANGTLALDVALKVLGVAAGDDVVVTSRTFLASVSSIVTAGANPIFADVDMNSQNVTAATIEKVLTENTKTVIIVHLAGMPADMDPIMALAEEHGFSVIEDCAQAHGARYKGRAVGSIGHIGAWSFCQDKIMTTGGEGGMVTTNDKSLWSAMWSYKDHGKSYDAVYNTNHPPGFRWLHNSFGTNWRMTEMQAAIGRIQLKKMESWTHTRQLNATLLDDIASRYSLIRLVNVPNSYIHAEYKHYFFVNLDQLAEGWSRDRIIDELNVRGVPCFQGSCSEVYLEKAFDNTPWRPKESLKNAKQLGEISLMMLVHPSITQTQMCDVCRILDDVLSKASK